MVEKRIKLGVLGANGRSGSQVVGLLDEFKRFELVAAVCAPQAPEIGRVCRTAEENFNQKILFTSDIIAASKLADIWIDFSIPESSLTLLRELAKSATACALATTGFKPEQLSEIKKLSTQLPLLFSSNMSRGVFVVGELVRMATKLLADKYEIEILEVHHRGKKDAPSGTALTLAECVKEVRNLEINTDRYSVNQLRGPNELGIASLRGGDTPGDHTVFFMGDGERVEITHRARDRSLFARGALEMAELLYGQEPGCYAMKDLLGG